MTDVLKCGKAGYKFQVAVIATAIENDKQSLSTEEKAAIMGSEPLTADTLLKGKTAAPRRFSTGSVGFNHSEKLSLEIGGVAKTFQVGVNIIAHGSKEWEDERPGAQAEQPSGDAEQPEA